MAIPLYLAMTAAEFRRSTALPAHPAWLSCLFSPYSTGLSNLPAQLPADSLLILSDRTPLCGHDPQRVRTQLEETIASLHCCALLLDFQRPVCKDAMQMVNALCTLPCPVAVSHLYAQEVDGPVFLPPAPVDTCIEDHLAPWQGREIWLEAALDSVTIRVTEHGAFREEKPLGSGPIGRFYDETLRCHYDIALSDCADFTLNRTADDLRALLLRAETLGVTTAVGLYQELANT